MAVQERPRSNVRIWGVPLTGKGVKTGEDQECGFGQGRFGNIIRTHSTVLSLCVFPLILFRF